MNNDFEPVRLTFVRALKMLAPAISILVCIAIHRVLPNVYPEGYEPTTYVPFLLLCLSVYLAFFITGCFWERLRKKLLHFSWLLAAAFLLIELLDIATLKTGYLRLPFIPSPDKIIEVIPGNAATLWESFLHSMQRLFTGIFFGMIGGFLSGVLMGWSRVCNYWIAPLLRVVGPTPSAAWLPIAIVVFPTSYWASIFLIAIAVWFPLTLMISSAIRSTDRRLVEQARVLGASEGYILFHVAIPAAVPSMFDGMFTGLSLSFSALIVAEMLGVKAGLGWYINWAVSWGEYAKVFATVAILTTIFSLMISLLFILRNRLLRWQKGTVRW